MEELKTPSAAVLEDSRKPYAPPSAEIILIEPEEKLALIDGAFHDDPVGNRWALNGWGVFTNSSDPASGVVGYVTPWELPDTSIES